MLINPALLAEARAIRAILGPGEGLFLISANGDRMMRVERASHLLTVGPAGEAALHTMSDIMRAAIAADLTPATSFQPTED